MLARATDLTGDIGLVDAQVHDEYAVGASGRRSGLADYLGHQVSADPLR